MTTEEESGISCSNDSTDDKSIELISKNILEDTSNILDDLLNDFEESLAANRFGDKTTDQYVSKPIEKLRIVAPCGSPTSSCYSSSSECHTSPTHIKKPKKRYCVSCSIRFKHTADWLHHLESHVREPRVKLTQLDKNSKYFMEYMERTQQHDDPFATAKITAINGEGLKMKLKISQNDSTSDNTESKGKPETGAASNSNKEIPRKEGTIRVLTAKEIKLSPRRTPPQLPLEAMVALSEMTFNNSQSNFMNDKIHFECPTLDGLDQFNDDGNKQSTADLLKHLLETPQLPQDNDWNKPTTNEYISIDRLAHICTVCHSNFPDAVLLRDHKHLTGHGFPGPNPSNPMNQSTNMMPHLRPQPLNNQQMNYQQRDPFIRPRSFPPQMPGYGQPPVLPLNQMHNQAPNYQMGPHPQQQRFMSNGARPPQQPQQFPLKRTPPPLYRAQGPQNQPANMAPFMQMNPDMYNPLPHGPNGGNGLPPGPFNQNQSNLMNPQRFLPGPSPLSMSLQQQHQHQQQQQQQHQQQQQQQQLQQQQQGPVQAGVMRAPIPNLRPNMARPPMIGMRRLTPPDYPNLNPNMSQNPVLRPNPNLQPPMKRPKLGEGDDRPHLSMQTRPDALPVIRSVQGGANLDGANKNDPLFQISDQITVKLKDKNPVQQQFPDETTSKGSREVANILVNRGITVTSSSKMGDPKAKSDDSAKGQCSSAEEAVQKLQLNNSVSIISKKKPTNTINATIDLSNDDDKEAGSPKPSTSNPASTSPIKCPIKQCSQRFLSVESLRLHTQRVHKAGVRVFRCKFCPAKFSSMEGLAFHNKTHHRSAIATASASEIGIPIVDLKNEQTLKKLTSLGITNYIPLGNFAKADGSNLGLPIVSVAGARNNNICNLLGLGADKVLSIGAIKAIPSLGNLNANK